jgi:uncharacterized membrane protein
VDKLGPKIAGEIEFFKGILQFFLSKAICQIFYFIFVLIALIVILTPKFTFAQVKCGGLNQLPCPVSQNGSACRKELREDFRRDRCVLAKNLARISFLKLCNNDSSEVISFVIVLWDSDLKKWVGRGWYRIDDRECTVVEIPGSYQGLVNVYAEMRGKTWTGTNGSFCVPRDVTRIFRSGDNSECRPPTFKRVDLFNILFEPRVSKTYYLKNASHKIS